MNTEPNITKRMTTWIKNILSKNPESESNLLSHARREFEVLGWNNDSDDMQKEMCNGILRLLETFSKEGHSGFSASYALSLFEKLSRYEPLSPLTGDDSEWNDISDNTFQNNRCSKIFKNTDGKVYNIDGKYFTHPDGISYTNYNSRVSVTFPYTVPEPIQVLVDWDDNKISKKEWNRLSHEYNKSNHSS